MVRGEEPRDWYDVYELNASVFETKAEAELVNALRAQAAPVVSLIAELDGALVGHVMFSPVALLGHSGLNLMGLAPMAVTQRHQREGIGSALVRAGLQRCKELGAGAVVVLGHAAYYPRFGFTPSARFDIKCEYDVAEEAFMILELVPEYLAGKTGTIRYHAAFGALEPR